MVSKNRASQQTLSQLVDSKDDTPPLKKQNSYSNQVARDSDREHIASGGELTHIRGAKIFTITEITKSIKNFLERNEAFNNIWLRGEISNFTHHRSGHMYFDLKDEDSVVSCVMFRAANQHLKFKPEHGMKILGLGSINVYLPHGKYQFVFLDLLPDGLGALHLAYLQLKEKLSKEGLFALEHKKPIPKLPKTIGIITSPTGAAIRDIIRVATRRFPGINIIISPSKVQGEDAASQLITGLQRLHEIGAVDLIIIGRGGGSLEDLWGFNEEIVARAIYNATIPIISAVGHETDFTISDFVADLRAPTPSAAAELAVPDIKELKTLILKNVQQIKQHLENKVRNNRLSLDRLLESPVFTRPLDRINLHRQNLDSILGRFSVNIVNYNKLKRSNLTSIINKFSAMNPKAILNRGYSITLKLPEETMLRSIDAVSKEDKIRVIMKDGALKCEVEEKSKKNILKDSN